MCVCVCVCVCVCLVLQLCLTLCDTMDCSPPGSSGHGDSPGKKTGAGCHALLQRDLPNPGIKPASLISCVSQKGSLPLVPPGKPHTIISSVQFSHSVVSDSLRPHELQHARPPCPSPTPGYKWCKLVTRDVEDSTRYSKSQ